MIASNRCKIIKKTTLKCLIIITFMLCSNTDSLQLQKKKKKQRQESLRRAKQETR